MSELEVATEQPQEESVLFTKAKKGPSKISLVKKFAEQMATDERYKVKWFYDEFLNRPTFDGPELFHKHCGSEFANTIQFLYTQWQLFRDAGFPQEDWVQAHHEELLAGAWAAAKADPAWGEVTGDRGDETTLYASWISGTEPEDIVFPEGWPGWIPGLDLHSQPAMQIKRIGAAVKDPDAVAAMKPKKEPKPKKEALPMDLRSVFDRRLKELDVNKLYRPWMQTKVLRLVTDPDDLRQWLNRVLTDPGLRHPVPRKADELIPAVAVDTENFEANGGSSGLDTRIVNGLPQLASAGICLSADGIEGLYVPLRHEDGNNCPIEVVKEVMQKLSDECFLIFFNGKYDREVLRIDLGITLRPYPYFEDVQVDHFLLDPKSEVDEEVSSFESAGLKALAERELGIDQIELEELAKVKISVKLPTGKTSQRTVLAPFNWIPTQMAVLYAAADAVTTWLLWQKMAPGARAMRYVHMIDHNLEDALAWVERMRPLIDVATLEKTCRWHQEKLEKIKKELSTLAELDDFNPGSTDQLARVLFEKYKFPVVKRSEKTGKPSTDESVIEELQKNHKGHPFLDLLMQFRAYAALHPDHLTYDKRDHTARMFFKQCTVAGGRLAAMGGKFEKDGGFGMNPQAIKSVGGNKWVTARRLRLEDTEDLGANFDPTKVVPLDKADLHPSCIKKDKEKIKKPNPAWQVPPLPEVPVDDGWLDADSAEREAKRQRMLEDHGRALISMKAAGIPEFLEEEVPVEKIIPKDLVNGHIARYCGEWWSLANDKPCLLEDGTEIALDAPTKVDCAEVINLRSLFVAPPGYTFFTVDYSNIEMRVAANCSGEPKFINEFLHGSGDFHTLTATNVFPEFSAPGTSKARKKELRSLAKIINFALLYGGTEHTIYENMKAVDPTITKEKAKAMVDKYWESVPKFYEWAQTMQIIAKEKLMCKTRSGRIINFRSAMKAQKIYEPLPEHYKNYRNYWNLRNMGEKCAKTNPTKSQEFLAKAQELILNKELGVQNVGDYKKFVSKAQRVAVNAPLQGLAGDFMRAALGAIHKWALSVGLGDIFLLHSTVHDEIDFSVKNEYVPFVLPRVVRLMKLRELHAKMKWPVPIETDCEYGQSWDVKEHLTGDDTHSPAGWTKVPGLERYIPAVFDKDTVRALAISVRSTDEASRKEAYDYLKEHTHKRCHVNIHTTKTDTPKLDALYGKDAVDALVAILQLHEYWTVEEQTADDPNEETLVNYQRRMGLAEGEIVTRPVVTPVAAPEVTETAQVTPETGEVAPPTNLQAMEITMEGGVMSIERVSYPVPAITSGTPVLRDGIPILRPNLTPIEEDLFLSSLGIGRKVLKVWVEGNAEPYVFPKSGVDEIPLQFLVLEEPTNA